MTILAFIVSGSFLLTVLLMMYFSYLYRPDSPRSYQHSLARGMKNILGALTAALIFNFLFSGHDVSHWESAPFIGVAIGSCIGLVAEAFVLYRGGRDAT